VARIFVEKNRRVRFVLSQLSRYAASAGWNAEIFCEKQNEFFVKAGRGPRQTSGTIQDHAAQRAFGTDKFLGRCDVRVKRFPNVIHRLPFALPDTPLIESATPTRQERGGDASRKISLPESDLKLRQGVGRLIRNQNPPRHHCDLGQSIVTKTLRPPFMQALPEVSGRNV